MAVLCEACRVGDACDSGRRFGNPAAAVNFCLACSDGGTPYAWWQAVRLGDMTDELSGGADPSGETQLSGNAPAKTRAVGRDDLAAFAAAQRQLVAVDFTALTAAQQAIK